LQEAKADVFVGRCEHDFGERAMPIVLHGLSPLVDRGRASTSLGGKSTNCQRLFPAILGKSSERRTTSFM
jgi:hypothetical protein